MRFFEQLSKLPGKKTKAELDAHYQAMENEDIGKKDMFAMILAGFIAFGPVLIVLLVAILLIMWFFRAL